jgi:stage II sporulation protein D
MKRSLILLLLLFVLTRCAYHPPMPVRPKGPSIRVGVVWGVDSIAVTTNASYQFADDRGAFIAAGDSGEHWIVSVRDARPAVIAYRLVAGSMSSRGLARNKARDVEALGFETEVRPVGPGRALAGKDAGTSKYYRVLLSRRFATEAEAKAFRDSTKGLSDAFLVRETQEPPAGLLVLHNVSKDLEFASPLAVHFTGAPVTLDEVPVGSGYHWEQEESRLYPDTVRFCVDSDGKAAAVVLLPVERYLEGVLPSEMNAGFPAEALKAQAVASRSKALSTLGMVHPTDPFDVCADVHCQVYSGMSRESAATARAVRETAGLVLWRDGRICDAVYGAVCGGHTEDVEKVWQTGPKPHLKGVIDGSSKAVGRYGSLEREENAVRWIMDRPRAYCNTADDDVPAALSYTKKYFRWELSLRQEDLRAQVEKRLGRSLGDIRELVPLSRGASGRIGRLKIVGTTGDTVISGELSIRKALSPTTLWSACFAVFKQEQENGPPTGFVLRGAGWGHGIGMCQAGAAGMALRGKRFDRILKTYFQGAEIKRIY